MMAHDFKKFPELNDSQLDFYYFESPHKQIFEDFEAVVTKVIDGDTIRVKWSERDFDFPVRFLNLASAELNEGGEDAQKWLEKKILNEKVTIKVDLKNRVGKWGRLLGECIFRGISINEEAILLSYAVDWSNRKDSQIINPIKDIKKMIK